MKTVGKPFWCPRRDDMARFFTAGVTFYPDPEQQIGTTALQDRWRDEGLRHAHITGGLPTCSYCGSLRPEDFIAALEAGQVEGTDKRYKAYVILPNPNAGNERIVGSTFREERPAGDQWIRIEELSAELRAGHEIPREGLSQQWVYLGPDSATSQAKFYFQHLAHPGPARSALYDWWQANGPGPFYSGGPLGLRLEHIARHPDEMTDAERTALEQLHARAPEIAAP